MTYSIKKTAYNGFKWSAIEKFSVQGTTFILQLILARLLVPSDYGIIGMLSIFLQIAQVFVDTGFANALIQKKQCSQVDYSTVFYYNLLVSISIYILFFFIAPFVSDFYHTEELTDVMRVLSLTVILNAIPIVNRTKLMQKIDFKTISKISLISTILSGLGGILFAYLNYGVWSLCIQSITNSILQCVLFCATVRWYPSLIFCFKSFNQLFGFGSRVLITNIIGALYTNMYAIFIGRRFTKQDLGYYTRADQFASFPASSFVSIVTRVVYPIFCSIQDDDEKLCIAYRKIIKISSYIIFPVMIGLLSISEPFIITFLSSKWEGAIILLQILCLDWILDHLSSINLNLLYVKGRTDLALKLEIIKKTIAVAILLVTVNYGIIAMCWGRALYSVIATIINTTYTKKFISLGLLDQIMDVLPLLIGASVMGGIVTISIHFFTNSSIQLVVGIMIGFISYYIISLLFFKDILMEIKSFKGS